MRYVITLFMVLVTLSACENNDFPGFKEVEVPGEKSVYMYDVSSVQKGASTSFQLLKKIDGGYIIQAASTDCSNKIILKDGFFYSYKDGAPKEYSGGEKPFEIGNDQHLRTLLKAVCPAAEKSDPKLTTELDQNDFIIIPYKKEQSGFLTKDTQARTNMDPKKSELVLIKSGNEVKVKGASEDGEWLEFEYGGHIGSLYSPSESIAVFSNP